jgi:uncharacterized protein
MCVESIARRAQVWPAATCGRTHSDLRNVVSVICPKCQNTMRTVDRQGIHIDQCDGCRGIFLDRGELESIMNAERQYSAQAAPPPYQPGPGGAPPPPQPGYGYRDSPRGGYGYSDSPRGYGHGGHHGGHRRRKSFMEQLFD